MNATASGIDWRLSDEEILAWLNEIVSKPTGLRVTFGDIQGAIGLQGLGEVVEAFEDAARSSAALRPTMTGLSSVGVLLDSQERLGVLQMVCPPQYFAAIKALAITEGPRWSIDLAMGTEPTLATIAAERESERIRREAVERLIAIQKTRSRWDNVSSQVRQKIESGAVSEGGVVVAVSDLWGE